MDGSPELVVVESSAEFAGNVQGKFENTDQCPRTTLESSFDITPLLQLCASKPHWGRSSLEMSVTSVLSATFADLEDFHRKNMA